MNPQKSTRSNASSVAAGIIFLIVGGMMLYQAQAGGLLLLIIGSALLIFGAAHRASGAKQTSDTSEQALKRRALSPDGKKPPKTGAAGSANTAEYLKPESMAQYSAEETKERRDELKGLYEGGLIDADEYLGRLREIDRQRGKS